MRKWVLGAAVFGFLGLVSQPDTRPGPAHARAAQPRGGTSIRTAAAASTAVVKQYCTGCHSERGKAGGLSLASFDVAQAVDQAPVSEKVIRKIRAGMMPPPGARRPADTALAALADALETRIDKAALVNPNPGWRPFQRLNRAEYQHAVKDLLALDVDVNAFLPPDTISHGFDNVADVQAFSPALMEGYLRAASRVTALAVGDAAAEPSEARYRVPKTASQLQRVDGAPFGTRGGVSVVHTFPADGEYVFRMDLHGNADGFLFGGPASGEQLELSINGMRKALIDIDPRMADVTTGLALKTPPIQVPAGRPARHGRVHPAVRRSGQRPDRADRSHARGHANRRRVRHHHAAPPERPQRRRPAARDGRFGDAEPSQDLHLPSDDGRRRAAVRVADRPEPGDAGVPPAGRRAGPPGADALLRRGTEGTRLRAGGRGGDRSGAGEPAVPLPHRSGRAAAHRRQGGPRRRSRSRVAFVLLPLGHRAGRRADDGRLTGPAAARRACWTNRRSACWRIRGRKRSRHGSRRSGCG